MDEGIVAVDDLGPGVVVGNRRHVRVVVPQRPRPIVRRVGLGHSSLILRSSIRSAWPKADKLTTP